MKRMQGTRAVLGLQMVVLSEGKERRGIVNGDGEREREREE